MLNWLRKQPGVSVPTKIYKKECWKLVKELKKEKAHENYNAEKLAKEYGLIILRLPVGLIKLLLSL